MPSKQGKQAVKAATRRELPRWLRWIPAGLLVVSSVTGLVWVDKKLSDPTTLPIRKVLVQGNFAHLNEAMLRKALGDHMQDGFFSVDVQQLRQRVNRLAWVDSASVRRVWPDTLVIRVVEQQPLARWQAGGLVNTRGEIFAAASNTHPKGLPLFIGAGGDSATVTAWYNKVMPTCTAMGRYVATLEFNKRGALYVKLDNDTEVLFGREHIDARLIRFTEVYGQSLNARQAEITRMDLRYTNGVAVRWKPGSMKQTG